MKHLGKDKMISLGESSSRKISNWYNFFQKFLDYQLRLLMPIQKRI
jgi:hypothetical protein